MTKHKPGRKKFPKIVPLRKHEFIVVFNKDKYKSVDSQEYWTGYTSYWVESVPYGHKNYRVPSFIYSDAVIVMKESRDKYFIRKHNGRPIGWKDKKWFVKPSKLEILLKYLYLYKGGKYDDDELDVHL